MSDDDVDNDLRDAFGAQLTAALDLRSRDDAPAVRPVVVRRRAHLGTRRRVLAGALTIAIVAGAAAIIADRRPHTVRTIPPADTTTQTTETTAPRPVLTPVTADQLLTAPIGALCGHPAGRFEGGKLPGIPEGEGFVELLARAGASPPFAPAPPDAKTVAIGDLDGDGVAEAVAVVSCSAGGNDFETQAVAWAPGPRLIGAVPFDDGGANTGVWPSSVSSVAIADGMIQLRGLGWQEGDCHACPSLSIARSVTMATGGTFTTDHTNRLGHAITMDGVGPVHAGTSFADLASLTNAPLEVKDPAGTYSPDSACVYFTILGTDRIAGTGANGGVEAIYLDKPAYRTERGVGPGSTVAELEAAYPGQLTRRPNQYRSSDDLYVGSVGNSGAAIRFILDQATGTHVDEVISGNQPAVGYSEGCS